MNHRYAQKLWGIVLAEEQDSPRQDGRALSWDGNAINQVSQTTNCHSLLAAALERVEQLIPRQRILVVTSRAPQDHLADWPEDNVIVQTADHGTAPSILLALAYLARHQPFATVAIFPEGSAVLNAARFRAAMQQAVEEKHRFPRKLTLLGLTPDHEADGYVAAAATVWEMVRRAVPDLYRDFMYIRRTLGKAHAEWAIESVYGMLTPTNFYAEVCTPLQSRLRVLDIQGDGQGEEEKRKRVSAALRHFGTTAQRVPPGQRYPRPGWQTAEYRGVRQARTRRPGLCGS